MPYYETLSKFFNSTVVLNYCLGILQFLIIIFPFTAKGKLINRQPTNLYGRGIIKFFKRAHWSLYAVFILTGMGVYVVIKKEKLQNMQPLLVIDNSISDKFTNNIHLGKAIKREARLDFRGYNDHPTIRNVMPYKRKNDSIAIVTGYTNIGTDDAVNIAKQVTLIKCKDGKLSKFGSEIYPDLTPVAPKGISSDMFYLHGFETNDSLYIYLKFSYSSKSSGSRKVLRQLYLYEPGYFGTKIPNVETQDFERISNFIGRMQLW